MKREVITDTMDTEGIPIERLEDTCSYLYLMERDDAIFTKPSPLIGRSCMWILEKSHAS